MNDIGLRQSNDQSDEVLTDELTIDTSGLVLGFRLGLVATKPTGYTGLYAYDRSLVDQVC
jgi:hypothetical protein